MNHETASKHEKKKTLPDDLKYGIFGRPQSKPPTKPIKMRKHDLSSRSQSSFASREKSLNFSRNRKPRMKPNPSAAKSQSQSREHVNNLGLSCVIGGIFQNTSIEDWKKLGRENSSQKSQPNLKPQNDKSQNRSLIKEEAGSKKSRQLSQSHTVGLNSSLSRARKERAKDLKKGSERIKNFYQSSTLYHRSHTSRDKSSRENLKAIRSRLDEAKNNINTSKAQLQSFQKENISLRKNTEYKVSESKDGILQPISINSYNIQTTSVNNQNIKESESLLSLKTPLKDSQVSPKKKIDIESVPSEISGTSKYSMIPHLSLSQARKLRKSASQSVQKSEESQISTSRPRLQIIKPSKYATGSSLSNRSHNSKIAKPSSRQVQLNSNMNIYCQRDTQWKTHQKELIKPDAQDGKSLSLHINKTQEPSNNNKNEVISSFDEHVDSNFFDSMNRVIQNHPKETNQFSSKNQIKPEPSKPKSPQTSISRKHSLDLSLRVFNIEVHSKSRTSDQSSTTPQDQQRLPKVPRQTSIDLFRRSSLIDEEALSQVKPEAPLQPPASPLPSQPSPRGAYTPSASGKHFRKNLRREAQVSPLRMASQTPSLSRAQSKSQHKKPRESVKQSIQRSQLTDEGETPARAVARASSRAQASLMTPLSAKLPSVDNSIVIYDEDDFEMIKELAEYNSKEDRIHFIEFLKMKKKLADGDGDKITKNVLTPFFKSKRLSKENPMHGMKLYSVDDIKEEDATDGQKTPNKDQLSANPGKSERRSRRKSSAAPSSEDEEKGTTQLKVKFYDDKSCVVFLPDDIDGLTIFNPDNPKSRRILTREKTPFGSSKGGDSSESNSKIPSQPQDLSHLQCPSKNEIDEEAESQVLNDKEQMGSQGFRRQTPFFVQSEEGATTSFGRMLPAESREGFFDDNGIDERKSVRRPDSKKPLKSALKSQSTRKYKKSQPE